MGSPIQHVFVLMLENRSFDHMLGWSGIGGTDAETNQPTAINGLDGSQFNNFNGQRYPVTHGADLIMPVDPPHEFTDVLTQLCGPAAHYPAGGAYPAIDDSGFVASYVTGGAGANPAEIMKGYNPGQLPVLTALATEFVVCDNWYSSMPGPTWPNRMFVHAASSGGLDHSPSILEIVDWETLNGFRFPNGTIFDALQAKGIPRRLYAGDDFPMVAALHGIGLGDIRNYSNFAADLAQPVFPYSYVFIEPSYDVTNKYKNGTSQHPLGDVTRGEALIKSTYEAIRNSALWPTSLLIVTWDENGGFYDHAIPPAAEDPGDTAPNSPHNQNGFTFRQYGSRVPAIVASPLIPRNRIDHRVYDHASIPATVEALFGLNSLTRRDAKANRLDKLLTLGAPRDTPAALPPAPHPFQALPLGAAAPAIGAVPAAAAMEPADDGNLPGIIQSALRQDLQISPPEQHPAILARVRTIQTRADAMHYLQEVQQKVRPLRPVAGQ